MATPKKKAASPKKALVHLTLDTDNLDAQIAAVIGNRVAAVLEKQLGNIVTGELARLKLSNKGGGLVIADVVQKQINSAIKAEVRKIADDKRLQIQRTLSADLQSARTKLARQANQFIDIYTTRLQEQIRNIRV